MKYILVSLAAILLAACSNVASSSETSEGSLFNLLLSSLSSKEDKLLPANYVKHVEEDNGLRAEKKIGEYTYTLQYKPLEYEALRYLPAGAHSAKSLDSVKRELGGMQYYTFSIRKENEGDFLKAHSADVPEYQQLVGYLSNEIPQDLLLTDGNDTLHCLLHHWERTFGITPDVKMILAFKAPVRQEKGKAKQATAEADKTLIFYDHVFGTGIIKLNIKGAAISHCPKLILSQDETI